MWGLPGPFTHLACSWVQLWCLSYRDDFTSLSTARVAVMSPGRPSHGEEHHSLTVSDMHCRDRA